MTLNDYMKETMEKARRLQFEAESASGYPYVIEFGPMELNAAGTHYECKITARPETEKDRFLGCEDPSCCGIKFNPDRHYRKGGLVYRDIVLPTRR